MRRLQRPQFNPLLALLLLALASCAQFGIEQPKSINDRVAYLTATVDSLVVSSTNALNAHTISSDDAQFVSTSARQLSHLAALASEDTDPRSAEGRLALAESILRELQTYVANHQKVSP